MKKRSQRPEVRGQATGTRACRLQRWKPDALVERLLAFLCLTLSASAAEPSARGSFAAGLQAFAASNYPAAGESFLGAAAAAPADQLDPAAAFYNAGLAAYAGGDLKAAADAFARAAAGSDLALQSQAYYNRGNALFQQVVGPAAAMAARPLPTTSTPELAGAEASVAKAIQMYENAIALDPKDVDAKANYELAVLKQQQLQQQQEQQKQDQQKQDQQDQDQPQDPKQEEPEDPQQKQQDQQQPAEPQPQPEPEQQQQPQEEPIEDDKPSEEMTPEEAAMMLDSMKAQEQSQRDRLHPFFGRPVPVEKDW